MSDSVRSGEPTPDVDTPGLVAPDAAPAATAQAESLGAAIRAGDWSRAPALARLEGADLEVQDALGVLSGVHEAVRARRYSAARRGLDSYARVLEQVAPGGDQALLRHVAPPEALRDAVNALDGLQKETDPQVLADGLAGALNLTLTRAEALNMQGILAAMLGEGRQARAFLEAAMQADAGHYRALTNLGNLDLEAGDAAAAEARYRQVIALNPEYDGGHHNLGVALRRQGKVGESVAAIRRAQRLGMKRSQDDTRADAREQFSRLPSLRWVRWALLFGAGGVIALLLRQGG